MSRTTTCAKEGEILEFSKDIEGKTLEDKVIRAGRYLVIEARSYTGEESFGPERFFPKGWQVTMIKLKPGDIYTPGAPRLSFYQKSNSKTAINRVNVVGKMKKTYIKED